MGRPGSRLGFVLATTIREMKSELQRVRSRWTRYEPIVIDEMGCVVMPESAAELTFQVIAGRAERTGIIVTTNLPFSDWTTMFPQRGCARRCWTGSPTTRTSSRPAPNPIDPADAGGTRRKAGRHELAFTIGCDGR